MERYLVFDGACSVCDRLAQTIQEAIGDKLEAVSIHDSKARSLLDRAFPTGWRHAPYLVTVRRGKIEAHTSFGAAVRLAWLMGPRQAWHVWSLARRSGIAVPPGGELHPVGVARRQFLKIGAAATTALTAFGWQPVHAAPAVPCDCVGCERVVPGNWTGDCTFQGACGGVQCGNVNAGVYFCNHLDCCTGYVCYTDCCNCFRCGCPSCP